MEVYTIEVIDDGESKYREFLFSFVLFKKKLAMQNGKKMMEFWIIIF